MEVSIWQEKVVIPTYKVGKPEKNPMFFEKRVYQGSSGVVYPHPVIEKIEDEKVDVEYIGLFIENKYLKIMILPEIGGRVQMAYDKIGERHFIYYNQVIKPALVGLCGPWISGGIEFNWPQHHRPSTFDPVDFKIEDNEDGSKTVWVSEVEKMFRTKGMAGFTLHPDKAYLEIKAQLYNRTNTPQTFLWWANPAVSVDDHYQSVFPPDVHAVFDHGKRDVSTFPIATGTYYKIDYSPGTDISKYKNIPVPTSYMAVNSAFDFVGGYQHDKKAGVLHVANHHVSPGKKQWTWGNGDFGKAWDRNLTDEDGPYIELMTGMFTDNQPDFSWLMPYEEKSFTQYFMPYREVGMVKNASKDLLIGIENSQEKATIKLFATSPMLQITVKVFIINDLLLSKIVDITPEKVFLAEIDLQQYNIHDGLRVEIINSFGKILLSYNTKESSHKEIPEAAKPAMFPQDVETTEELFLIGQHLEQYRHATYNPVDYYQEALRRQPSDIRNNNALGLYLLRKGQFEQSIFYFKRAIQSITSRNPNPYESEPYYNLGLALKYLGKIDLAYDAFFKSTWSSTWQDPGYFSVAQIDIARGDYELALEHINWSIDKNARNGKAYVIKIHALRKLRRYQEAINIANAALARDKFNLTAIFELSLCYLEIGNEIMRLQTIEDFKLLSRGEYNTLIEYSIEYAEIGLFELAIELLKNGNEIAQANCLINYYYAFYYSKLDDSKLCDKFLEIAASSNPDYCFPNRLEDILVLEFAANTNSKDSKVDYYLGNLWYDKRQYDNAIKCWSKSAQLNPYYPTVHRNLAIANYNKLGNKEKALNLFEKAYNLDQSDARILMELDQLYKKLNYSPDNRLTFLLTNMNIVHQRDDLFLEVIALKNFTGQHQEAFDQLMLRKFHPWEGGEGKVSGQYIYSLVELAKADIMQNNYEKAIEKLNAAKIYPDLLGEGKLPGAQENDIDYWLGCSFYGLNSETKAMDYWHLATIGLSEPSAAIFYNDQQPDKIFYQGLAWKKLNEESKANQIFNNLIKYGFEHQNDDVKLDYFAVSLPDLLIFEDDLNKRNHLHCRYIMGLGYLGIENMEEAEKCFKYVLDNDSMHFGAKTHLTLLLSQV